MHCEQSNAWFPSTGFWVRYSRGPEGRLYIGDQNQRIMSQRSHSKLLTYTNAMTRNGNRSAMASAGVASPRRGAGRKRGFDGANPLLCP